MESQPDITDIDNSDGVEFETIVKEILLSRGFENLERTTTSGDFGADILATKEEGKYVIQTKRATGLVGLAAVQQVLGATFYYKADKAIVVSNSSFSSSAQELAKRGNVQLVDRKILKRWISEIKLDGFEAKIVPRAYQAKALDRLAQLRKQGDSRSLIVMASGLGKTYVAALDARAFQENLGKPVRILYLSHQNVILEQARRKFHRIFGPKRKYGMFHADERNLGAEIVFATFQSLNNSLESLDPDAFDYVVVDEAHHTAAPTRDLVVQTLRPRFLLGLTATPIRADGKDIYTYYNDVVAASLPLEAAVAEGLLTPIDYRVCSDSADPSALNAVLHPKAFNRTSRLFTARSDRDIVKLVEREARKIGESVRAVVFCASLNQMDHFAGLFKNCRSISGRDSREQQIEIVESFMAADFPILLARDVLNEGIDVPDVNLIVFLRNTESPVVFLQQLGRGLRRTEGKEKVVVLDFVNNVERINFVYALYSRLLTEHAKRSRRNHIRSQTPMSLDLDQTAKDVIDILVRKKEESGHLVEVGSLIASFDYRVSSYTLRKLVEIGSIIPDFRVPMSDGREKFFLERPTLERFMREVRSTRPLENYLSQGKFARAIGKKLSWVRDKEKWGYVLPSWVHVRLGGQVDFYFTEQDVEEYTSSN